MPTIQRISTNSRDKKALRAQALAQGVQGITGTIWDVLKMGHQNKVDSALQTQGFENDKALIGVGGASDIATDKASHLNTMVEKEFDRETGVNKADQDAGIATKFADQGAGIATDKANLDALNTARQTVLQAETDRNTTALNKFEDSKDFMTTAFGTGLKAVVENSDGNMDQIGQGVTNLVGMSHGILEEAKADYLGAVSTDDQAKQVDIETQKQDARRQKFTESYQSDLKDSQVINQAKERKDGMRQIESAMKDRIKLIATMPPDKQAEAYKLSANVTVQEMNAKGVSFTHDDETAMSSKAISAGTFKGTENKGLSAVMKLANNQKIARKQTTDQSDVLRTMRRDQDAAIAYSRLIAQGNLSPLQNKTIDTLLTGRMKNMNTIISMGKETTRLGGASGGSQLGQDPSAGGTSSSSSTRPIHEKTIRAKLFGSIESGVNNILDVRGLGNLKTNAFEIDTSANRTFDGSGSTPAEVTTNVARPDTMQGFANELKRLQSSDPEEALKFVLSYQDTY